MASMGKGLRLYLKASMGFPNLTNSNHEIKSSATDEYNCIAWAVGIDNEFIWPDVNCQYWPDDLPLEPAIEALIMFYQRFGFDECESGNFEDGFEKIALYVASNGQPKHAARQINEKLWTSKLGGNVDIEHTLDAIEGPTYGSATVFMKRPLNMHGGRS